MTDSDFYTKLNMKSNMKYLGWELYTLVRERIKGDNKKIYRLILEELVPYTRLSFPQLKVRKDDVIKRIQRGVTYVVGSEAIGFVHAFTQKKKLWIDMIVVHKRNRGKGWGKLLLRKAEDYGKSKKCRTAFLYVDKMNEDVQKFYVQQGNERITFEKEINCYLYSKIIE